MKKRNFRLLSAIVIMVSLLLYSCEGSSRTKNTPQKLHDNASEVIQPEKPVVNVYIENSYSLDGYVNGETEFKEAVFNYIGRIKRLGITDTLNLYYINRVILWQGAAIKDSSTVIMQDFVQKLNPTTFKNKGGRHEDRQESDLANIIKSVLSITKSNEISILVSDGIFSPGKQDAANYLSSQREGIAIAVDEYLDKYPNAAVMVYQLSSIFNGTFYDKTDKRIPIKEQRPYYIYVFGDLMHLSNLRKKSPDSDFIGGGVNNVFSVMSGNKEVYYFINPSIGKFQKSKKDTKATIEGLEKDSRTGNVKFAVNVDLSGMLLDEAYLLNSDNYENNSKYDLEIKPSATQNSNFTHIFNFTSDRIFKGPVVVKLKARRPAWIDEVNDNDGTTAAKGKTYGIKYQLDGIYDAFTQENKYYMEFKININ